MKILLVGFSKIKYMPYLDFYLKNMNPAEHEIHLIYWNRDLKPEETGHLKNVVLHEFLCAQEDNVQKSQKIASFLKFRAFAKKVLGKHRFDLVVTLHSMPAVLLKGIWTRKYKDRFIFDYRDSTYERHGFFLKMIHSLILASKATFTSSDGFRVLFPENAQNKIYTTHNLDLAALSLKKPKRISSDRIRVSYWGFIRDPKTNRALIEKFSADKRFELHFFGREQKTALQLKAYAGEIGAKNVTFHGEYSPEERYDFVKNTLDQIPQASANAKRIVGLVKEGGRITGYQLSDNSIVKKQQAVDMAKQGEISGVGIAHRGDTEYLKSIPDGSENNNLGNLPSVSPGSQG